MGTNTYLQSNRQLLFESIKLLEMFNYNHLFYFYTTARLGSVTNAAKLLRIAQSSLSMQLKTNEQAIGQKLFQKVGRKLQLTPVGERVFEYCRRMFEASEELDDYLKHSSSSDLQRCRIGVSPEIERPFVADVLGSLLNNNKSIDRPLLSLITNEHKQLITRLANGEIDVVVTNHEAHAPNIKTIIQLSMPVFAVANLKRLKSLSSEMSLNKLLKKEMPNLVLPSETLKLRLESDLFLQKHKSRNDVVFESDILSVIVRAIIDGVGIGMVPKMYIDKEITQKRLTVLNNGTPLWETKLFVLIRKQKKEDPIVQLIKKHFLELGAVDR